ncbi:replication-relaxation family protein [Brevundimonas sp.]|uniref:replication-relaxation family protein n=1 Tax=Brevundimonas sp. TaxID=1871086 RepID=UPI003D0E0B6E
MSSDALHRRLRTAGPQPRVRRLVLTDADIEVFAAIARHGPLPTPYLYAFTKALRRDYTHLQNRLTDFYNGDGMGVYLVRPPQQFATYEARYQHLVYDLAPRARAVLRAQGLESAAYPHNAGPFVHRLMQACVSASLELSARRAGVTFIGRDEILAHPNCPVGVQASAQPLRIDLGLDGDRALIPDNLLGIRHPSAGYRFFALEADRHTESIERRSIGQSAFGTKIRQYAKLLAQARYRAVWGIPNLHVLIVTTNAGHASNLQAHVARVVPPASRRAFVFGVDPTFGVRWRVPSEARDDFALINWMTGDGETQLFGPHVVVRLEPAIG